MNKNAPNRSQHYLQLILEIYKRIPKHRKTTAKEIQQQLTNIGIDRSERSIQRNLADMVQFFDDIEMDNYLIRGGCDDAVLVCNDGEQIVGQDLIDLVDNNRKARALIGNLSKDIPEKIIEQMSIVGLFNKELINDIPELKSALESLCVRLNALEAEYDKGWKAEIMEDGYLSLYKELRGVEERYVIGSNILDSNEARALNKMKVFLKETYSQHQKLVSPKLGEEKNIYGPVSFVDAIMAMGKKGIAIQRYKGLGEMNAEQLWETTLDPEVRTLLQVRADQMDEADEVFSTLMGEVVEPRKEFIQQNALNVINLDV